MPVETTTDNAVPERDCYNCNDYFPENEMISSDYGEDFCQECYDDCHTVCDSCNSELHNDEVHWAPGGDYAYCEDCYHDAIQYCEPCGEDRWQDDMRYCDSRGEYFCEDCYDEYSGNSEYDWNVYSNNYIKDNDDFVTPSKSKYSNDTFSLIKSKRYQGIEIETNFGNEISNSDVSDLIYRRIEKTRDKVGLTTDTDRTELEEAFYAPLSSPNVIQCGFNVVYDGSVTGGDDQYGAEVVVSPRRGDILYNDMLTITKTLKEDCGAYISRKCGYHLHIDTRDYDWQHFLVLTLMTKMIEPHIYSWLPSSRRSSNWCKPVSQTIDELRYINDRDSFLEYYYDDCRFTNEKYNEKRYHGLNLHSHFQANQGVEIRYHSGTLNPDKMLHWSILWSQIIDKCYELGNQLAEEMRTDNTYDLYKTSLFKSLITTNVLDIEAVELERLQVKYYRQESTNIKEYKEDSKYLSDLLGLDNRDKVYAIEPMIYFLKRRKYLNATMTIDSLFDTFDIPVITQEFYKERMVEIMENSQTPSNHITRCFAKSDLFVSFDESSLQFKLAGVMNSIFPTIDSENIKVCGTPESIKYIQSPVEPSDLDDYAINPSVFDSQDML